MKQRCHWKVTLAAAALTSVVAGGAVRGQVAGEFVVPDLRGTGHSLFAYWDLFVAGPGGANYLFENEPALGGGEDSDGNATNFGTGATAARLSFVQDGTPTAFVTSSNSIYSFANVTSFTVGYTAAAGEDDVANVLVQTQTGGVRFRADHIRLHYVKDGQTVTLAPDYKALDDPRTGAFTERLVSGFQWDVTGLGVRDFAVKFSSPDSSMPLWQAQLDVVTGNSFQREFGYVLEERAAPALRFGAPGLIDKGLSEEEEYRYFLPGRALSLRAEAQAGFEHVGWAHAGTVTAGAEFTLTFGEGDETITALYAPLHYTTWRNHFFEHANTLLGQAADNLDDAISGPAADPDGDGDANFAEFAFGGDPYVPDAAGREARAQLVDGVPALTFRRWAAEEIDLVYALEASTDGGPWTTVAADETASELQADGTRLVTWKLSTAPAAGATTLLRVTATTP